MSKLCGILLLTCLVIILPPGHKARCEEIQTRIIRIQCDGEDDLRQFNKRVNLGSFSFRFGRQNQLTIEQEVKSKVNTTIARVQEILDMYPPEMKLDVVLLPSVQEVRNVYAEQYHRTVKFIAFYSPKTNAVYLSVRDVNINVFSHELAHAVINHYFANNPPVKIHELLAQYVESQMGND